MNRSTDSSSVSRKKSDALESDTASVLSNGQENGNESHPSVQHQAREDPAPLSGRQSDLPGRVWGRDVRLCSWT